MGKKYSIEIGDITNSDGIVIGGNAGSDDEETDTVIIIGEITNSTFTIG